MPFSRLIRLLLSIYLPSCVYWWINSCLYCSWRLQSLQSTAQIKCCVHYDKRVWNERVADVLQLALKGVDFGVFGFQRAGKVDLIAARFGSELVVYSVLENDFPSFSILFRKNPNTFRIFVFEWFSEFSSRHWIDL